MAREIRIIIPDKIYERIMKICRELHISTQDILMRAIVKTLEDFEKTERRRGR